MPMESIGITYDGQETKIKKAQGSRIVTLGLGMAQLTTALLWCDTQLDDRERILFIRNRLRLTPKTYVDYEVVHQQRLRCCLRVYAQKRDVQEKIIKQLGLSYRHIHYIETIWHGLGRALLHIYKLKDAAFCCLSMYRKRLVLSVHRDQCLLYQRNDVLRNQQPIYAMRRMLACYFATQEALKIQHCFCVGVNADGSLPIDAPMIVETRPDLISYGLALRGIDV